MHWLSFIGGVFVGGMLGVLIMCFCAVAGDEDRGRERLERRN